MRARGKIRKLLISLGEIQNLAGEAKGVYLDDRAQDRAGRLIPLLEKIFAICLDELSEYDPIEDKSHENISKDGKSAPGDP